MIDKIDAGTLSHVSHLIFKNIACSQYENVFVLPGGTVCGVVGSAT